MNIRYLTHVYVLNVYCKSIGMLFLSNFNLMEKLKAGLIFACMLIHITDKINEERLDAIPAKGKLFKAKDRGEEAFIEQLKHCVAPEDLKLKIGAQVMLIIVRNT